MLANEGVLRGEKTRTRERVPEFPGKIHQREKITVNSGIGKMGKKRMELRRKSCLKKTSCWIFNRDKSKYEKCSRIIKRKKRKIVSTIAY